MKWFWIKVVVLVVGVSVGIYLSSQLNFLTDVVDSYIHMESDSASSIKDVTLDEYQNDLVLVNSVYNDFIIDLKYATKDNVTGEVLYGNNLLYLQKNTLSKLIDANEELMSKGYRLKIWDGYRPISVQRKLWAKMPNSNFIANPFTTASNHNRGSGVDVTLVKLDGSDVKMPTSFDNFTSKSFRGSSWSAEEIKNVQILTDAMSNNGFNYIDSEWWHYDDVNAKEYPIMDFDSVDLLKK